jgi:hypothetical protein
MTKLFLRNGIQASSVEDPGFIPDPGSDFFPSRIPDPGSSKNLSILTPKKQKKWFLSSKNMIRVVHPDHGSGC